MSGLLDFAVGAAKGAADAGVTVFSEEWKMEKQKELASYELELKKQFSNWEFDRDTKREDTLRAEEKGYEAAEGQLEHERALELQDRVNSGKSTGTDTINSTEREVIIDDFVSQVALSVGAPADKESLMIPGIIPDEQRQVINDFKREMRGVTSREDAMKIVDKYSAILAGESPAPKKDAAPAKERRPLAEFD